MMDKAHEFLSDGIYLLKDEREEGAANRAYYAAFTAARALLHALNIQVKSHNGVQTKFSQHFIKTKVFDVKYKRIISLLFDVRQRADYDFYTKLELEQAQRLIDDASDFVHLAEAYLEEHFPE
jgi:uncharacterized protein (UPF0332 family)